MDEILIFFSKEITEFYPYRSAKCIHSMQISLSPSQKQDLREYLGPRMDNHITWKSGDLCYTYSDGNLFIGTSIQVGCW